MNNPQDRRRFPRETLVPPEVGFFFAGGMGYDSKPVLEEPAAHYFVDIFDISQGGALIKSEKKVKPNDFIQMQVYNSFENLWKDFKGNVKWVKRDFSNPNYYHIGVATQQHDPTTTLSEHKEDDKQIPCPTDYEFFRNTKLLRFIPRNAVCPLLNRVTYKHLSAGERLMSQGESGDACFIIQRGMCVANVERDGELHTVARLRAGP